MNATNCHLSLHTRTYLYSLDDDTKLDDGCEDGDPEEDRGTPSVLKDDNGTKTTAADGAGKELDLDRPSSSGIDDDEVIMTGVTLPPAADDLSWPTLQDLNTRLRRVITAYQRNYKKEELRAQQQQKAKMQAIASAAATSSPLVIPSGSSSASSTPTPNIPQQATVGGGSGGGVGSGALATMSSQQQQQAQQQQQPQQQQQQQNQSQMMTAKQQANAQANALAGLPADLGLILSLGLGLNPADQSQFSNIDLNSLALYLQKLGSPQKIEQQMRERDRARLQQLNKKFSRREENEFVRVLTGYGIDLQPNTNVAIADWSRFKAMARLEKKSDDMLSDYYKVFIAMCKRQAGIKLLEDEKGLENILDEISEDHARLVLDRLELLSKLRELVKQAKMEERLRLCKNNYDTPDWWEAGKHDRELVRGVLKHGLYRTETLIMNDSEFSFRDACKRYELELDIFNQNTILKMEAELLKHHQNQMKMKLEQQIKDETEKQRANEALAAKAAEKESSERKAAESVVINDNDEEVIPAGKADEVAPEKPVNESAASVVEAANAETEKTGPDKDDLGVVEKNDKAVSATDESVVEMSEQAPKKDSGNDEKPISTTAAFDGVAESEVADVKQPDENKMDVPEEAMKSESDQKMEINEEENKLPLTTEVTPMETQSEDTDKSNKDIAKDSESNVLEAEEKPTEMNVAEPEQVNQMVTDKTEDVTPQDAETVKSAENIEDEPAEKVNKGEEVVVPIENEDAIVADDRKTIETTTPAVEVSELAEENPEAPAPKEEAIIETAVEKSIPEKVVAPPKMDLLAELKIVEEDCKKLAELKARFPDLEVIQPASIKAKTSSLDAILAAGTKDMKPFIPKLLEKQLLIRWFRDFALEKRLSHIIYCVEKSDWPVGKSYSAYTGCQGMDLDIPLFETIKWIPIPESRQQVNPDVITITTDQGLSKQLGNSLLASLQNVLASSTAPGGSGGANTSTQQQQQQHQLLQQQQQQLNQSMAAMQQASGSSSGGGGGGGSGKQKGRKRHIAIDVETERAKLHALLNNTQTNRELDK